jgi:uncharacterized membrane protein HdeD (DUF308 family)
MMKVCKAVNGVLVLVAGVAMFMNLSIAGLTGAQVAGVMFVLFGVSKLVHALGFCSACTSCCVETKKK